jgi:hypothetical protein
MDLIQSTQLIITQLTTQILNLDNNFNKILDELTQKDLIIDKLNNDIIIKDKIILEKIQELENFSKVSVLISTNKELANRNNYIKILEEQLTKLKNNNKTYNLKENIKEIIKDIKNIKEDIKENIKESEYIKDITKDIIKDNDDITENIKKEDNNDIKENIIKDNDDNFKKDNDDNFIKDNDDNFIKDIKKDNIKKDKLLNFNIDDYKEIDNYELILYKKNYYLKNNLLEIYNIKKYKPYKLIGNVNSNGKIIFL